VAVLPEASPVKIPVARGLRALGEPLLDVSGLSKRFPTGKQALDSVCLQVHPGDLAVVLGANGSGKSTLLRCCVRLIDPTAGSVRVSGHDLAHLDGAALREARMAVAMIFQQANLVRRCSALANVVMGTLGRHSDMGSKLGLLPREEYEHAMACLGRVGLPHVAEQRADTLSGGQAQRVAIARGLSQRPRVLLADEPVASLDPEAAQDVMALLRLLAEEERLGIVCVLHQPALALRFGHRILGLRDGRVVFDRSAEDVTGDHIAQLYRADVEAA